VIEVSKTHVSKTHGFARVRRAALEALLLGASLAAAGSLSSARASRLPPSPAKTKVAKSAPPATRPGEHGHGGDRVRGTDPALASWILGETATSTNEFRINTYTTHRQSASRIATDSAGNFVVVWQSDRQDGSFYGVFGQRYASGGAPLGLEFPVNTFTTSYQGRPSVACAAGGDFVAVWQSSTQDGSEYAVIGRRYDAGGGPLGAEFQVNDYTTSSQVFPSVAADSAGNFVVVWERTGPSTSGIFGRRWSSSGAPLGAEFRLDTFTTNNPASPMVASDGVGNFVVVWSSFHQPSSTVAVHGRRYGSTGAPTGDEFLVNTFATSFAIAPSVSMDSSGGFVVVWQSSQEVSSYGVFGRLFDGAGAPLGTEFRVNTYTPSYQGVPSVTMDAGGGFVVVWHGDLQDGSQLGVFGQRYDGMGAPLGTEFRVNSYTTGSQGVPAVGGRPGGGFVVVWQSEGQDGSVAGIFGRRFCSDLVSVTVDVTGSTTICPTSKGGMATVTDVDGGVPAHQWGYRMLPGGPPIPIDGQTGSSYSINGANFPGPGFYYLFCFTNPECGAPMFSNDIVVIVAADMTAPLVEPPRPATLIQTICN